MPAQVGLSGVVFGARAHVEHLCWLVGWLVGVFCVGWLVGWSVVKRHQVKPCHLLRTDWCASVRKEGFYSLIKFYFL